MEVIIEAISLGLWGQVASILASQSTMPYPHPPPTSILGVRQVEGICQVVKLGQRRTQNRFLESPSSGLKKISITSAIMRSRRGPCLDRIG